MRLELKTPCLRSSHLTDINLAIEALWLNWSQIYSQFATPNSLKRKKKTKAGNKIKEFHLIFFETSNKIKSTLSKFFLSIRDSNQKGIKTKKKYGLLSCFIKIMVRIPVSIQETFNLYWPNSWYYCQMKCIKTFS